MTSVLPRFRWAARLLEWSAVAGVALGVGAFSLDFFHNEPSISSETLTEPVVAVQRVSALGRIEPGSQVIRVGGVEGERVREVLVAEGDPVQPGQVLARLESHDRLQVAVEQARREVQVAQAQLARVQAGGSPSARAAQEGAIGRIEADLQANRVAQEAGIRRLQAEVDHARDEYERHRYLAQEGAISTSFLEGKRLVLVTAEQQLQEANAQFNGLQMTTQQDLVQARAILAQISEVRGVDVQLAEAEVSRAQAALNRAEVEVELGLIRAPQAGQVLKIHTRAGEQLSDHGILELGETQQMVVMAEVYQTDIQWIKNGQSVQILGTGDPLQGSVVSIGRQVQRQTVFANQPGENLDRRIIEVRIELDPSSSQQVSGLTNMQVQVLIDVGS